MIKVALRLRFGIRDTFWAPGNLGNNFLLPRLALRQFAVTCGKAVPVGVPTLCQPVLSYLGTFSVASFS